MAFCAEGRVQAMSRQLRQRWGCTSKRALALLVMLALFTGSAAALFLPQRTEGGLKKKNGTVVDVGHADQGYVYAMHKASKKRLKLRIAANGETYTYDLNQNGEFELFPLQLGSGRYKVSVYEQIKDTQYASISSISFDAAIEDENLPYLYPSQYVLFDENSEAVAMSYALCEGLESDEAKMQAVERFVGTQFMYDYLKSVTVQSATSYLPDVDETLRKKQGICFDFAALVACMLRAQGIPTQLVIGYADSAYHAWNRVLIDGDWRLVDTTAKITNTTVRKYTAQRHY